MEKVNIAELLKDCPKGMELDCPMFENLEFNRVEEDNGTYYIIGQVKTEIGYNVHTFTKHGCYTSNKYAKCVIFPKGKTTWEGFQRPFKDGDIIYIKTKNGNKWLSIYKEFEGRYLRTFVSIVLDNLSLYYTHSSYNILCSKEEISEQRLATEDEKEILFQVIKDNGYKWNPETKTLEELPKFKDGDIVTWKDRGSLVACIYKERKNTVSFYHHIALYKGGLGIVVDGEIVLMDDELSFATEEEKQKLFDAIKENSYEWNAETKTLKKMNELKFKIGDRITNGIVTGKIRSRDVDSYQLDNDVFVFFSALEEWKLDTSKFDITTLKPFKSEVLIRNDKTQKWIPAFWGYKADNGNYVTTFGACRYCIPYEGNEHLLRTSNDCDNYYKIWEA